MIRRRSKTLVGDYRLFPTAWGWCAAARTGLGVCAFVLPMEDRDAAEAAVRRLAPGAASLPRGMAGLVRQVQRYFDGRRVEFEADLDFTAATAFQRRVWRQACLVPYGRVMTYAGLAMGIGQPRATRAAAGALARNPIPLLVPCHRIVGSDGSLAGFSAAGGVETKRAMLALEGVPMFGEGEETRILASPA